MHKLAVTAVAILFGVSFAQAQEASKKVAPSSKSARGPTAIEVVNGREVVLKTFVLYTRGENPETVVQLSKPLRAGGAVRLMLVRTKECEYDAKWEFADAGSEATVNICNDPKIMLND